MGGRIVVPAGLWPLRDAIRQATEREPVAWTSAPAAIRGADAVAGRGTAAGRAAAQALGKTYVAITDGFLRSVRPTAPTLSLIVDRTGVHFDARRPSDLEALIRSGPSAAERARAGPALALLRAHRLSRLNAGTETPPEALRLDVRERQVLVVDQPRGAPSIAGALAGEADFQAMLAAAIAENPGCRIFVKTYPEAGMRGHLAGAAQTAGATLVDDVAPWVLFDRVAHVYTVSSTLGLEALIAGCRVTCFGMPFYAGWGLTDDRVPGDSPGQNLVAARARRGGPVSVPDLFAAAYLRHTTYVDPYSRRPIAFEEAVEILAFLRRRFLGNDRPAVCVGISRWKRPAVTAMLDGVGGPPRFVPAGQAAPTALRDGGRVVAWQTTMPETLEADCRAAGVALLRMEDGFLRSVGLGAAFTPGTSFVLDSRGIYFDPRQESDLEALLATAAFPPELTARAAALRERIVQLRLTKYNVGGPEAERAPLALPPDRRIVLVPGQVEDDASIRFGSPRVRSNLALLAAARQRNPDAFILFKPHPDVEAGLRTGRVAEDEARAHADAVVTGLPITTLLDLAGHVETMTSLAGFEALLRGRSVAVHGQPFYAGWGLTEDLAPIARRTRRLTLDELAAGTLILYPHYVDIAAGLPCPPEVAVDRLAEARRSAGPTPLGRIRHLKGRLHHLVFKPLSRIVGGAGGR